MIQMQPKEILEKAADLLEKKDWTSGAYARNSVGEPVSPQSSHACSFCMVGAVLNIDPSNREALVLLYEQLSPPSHAPPSDLMIRLTHFNDGILKGKENTITFLRGVAQNAS